MTGTLALLIGLAVAPAQDARGSDAVATIRQEIEQAAQACVDGDIDKSLRQYDQAVRITFPNSPEATLQSMRRDNLIVCRGEAEGRVKRMIPQFDETLVYGRTAVVRLTWAIDALGRAEPRKLGEMQIWRRVGNRWKYVRGARWPLRSPASN